MCDIFHGVFDQSDNQKRFLERERERERMNEKMVSFSKKGRLYQTVYVRDVSTVVGRRGEPKIMIRKEEGNEK